MKIAAVISEYNPFHNGHLAHINATRQLTGCDAVISVMSGNFVQRGEPAVFDKYFRARAAVLCGADMVIELPAVGAVAAADVFAAAAVRILNDIKEIEYLSFGSESGNLDDLINLSKILNNETQNISEQIQKNLDEGMSYPLARSRAIKAITGEKYFDILYQPNNILALEYIRHLELTKSHIKPVTIKRVGAGYHDPDFNADIPSATALRLALSEGSAEAVLRGAPEQVAKDYLNEFNPRDKAQRLYELIRYELIHSSAHIMRDIADIGEGLEHRILKAINEPDYCSFLNAVKSKRYTMARIKRILLYILLGIKKKDIQKVKTAPLYKNVLAIKKEKLSLLSLLGKNRITRKQDYDNIKNRSTLRLLNKNILSDDLFSIISDDKTGGFLSHGMVIV